MPKKFNILILLTILFGFFSLGILLFRHYYTQGPKFWFLGWNLFLGTVPLLISTFLVAKKHRHIINVFSFLAWFFFYPNASYLITDIMHLRRYADFYVWFETLLLFCFAIYGLAVATLSLYQMHKEIAKNYSKRVGLIFANIVLAASTYGVYIGRFNRLNSWELVSDPYKVLFQLISIDYLSLTFIGFTGIFFAITAFCYWGFYLAIETD